MNSKTLAAALLAALLLSRAASVHGHGTPILVDGSSGTLTVSGGIADGLGFAPWVFADPDPESWLAPTTPSMGNARQLTTLPGIDFSGVSAGDEMTLEILERPDFSTPGNPQKRLWHWSQATETVVPAANDPWLDVQSLRVPSSVARLTQEATPGTNTVSLGGLLGSDINIHKHFFAYFLDDSPPADAGVYAFFARLSAPGYEPSQPFLVALNLNVFDEELYLEGALAINAAARMSGDYDANGVVDGADLLLWQRQLGGSLTGDSPADGNGDGVVDGEDLEVWELFFGSAAGGAAAVSSVPEPSGESLLFGFLGLLAASHITPTSGSLSLMERARER